MKFLYVVSAMNAICVVVLTYVFWQQNNDVESTTPSYHSSDITAVCNANENAAAYSDLALRELVREEFGRLEQRLIGAIEQPAYTIESNDEGELGGHDEQLEELISARIESFSSLGTIGSNEMESIYSDLGKLPETQRDQLMSKLARAININQIDVQFN